MKEILGWGSARYYAKPIMNWNKQFNHTSKLKWIDYKLKASMSSLKDRQTGKSNLITYFHGIRKIKATRLSNHKSQLKL